MKKQKIIALSAIACFVCAGAGIFALSGSADTNVSEKNIRYEYALLGEIYTPEDGLISAKSPEGTVISDCKNGVLLDWAQGSYTFEYKNKIIDLKVYESAPEDEITLSGEIAGGGIAGVVSEFPACNVKSGIVRTDGAPEVGEYAVSAVFSKNGETAYTVRNAGEAFTYTPEIGGIWQISYTYTDVFGVARSKDYTFSVADKKIILTDVSAQYKIGEKISFSGTYGYFKGEKFNVKVSVFTSSGKTENTNGSYVFGEAGQYAFTFSSEIQGETVREQISVNVSAGLASFIADKTGFSGGEEFINHSNVSGAGSSEKGILFDMSASEAELSYNGVIDLKKLGKNSPVISFTTNNSHGGTLSCVEVTLTDVYDSKNAVTVRFAKNGDTTETRMSYDNTLVRASFGSVSTAFNNYYPLKTDAVAWNTRFDTLWLSTANTNPDKNYEAAQTLHTMNFAFDTATNEIYSYGDFSRVGRPDGNESGVKWWKIAELSAPSLPVQFGGFTTGEVYLSLKVVSGKGDIVVDSIGGKTMSVSADDYEDASSILFGTFNGNIPAVKGKAYPIPRYSGKYVSDLAVYAEIGDERTHISGDSFIPDKAGNYTLVCEGTNSFGKKISRAISFVCVEAQIPVNIGYDDVKQPKIGEVYTVEEPVLSGGHGKVTYTITVNGAAFSIGDKLVVSGDRLEIVIRTVDELGFTEEQAFTVEADKDVLIFDIDFPRAAIAGSEFTFPKATATYYKTGEILPYEIYLNGVKVTEEKIVLPADKTQASVEYRTTLGSETYTLQLKGAATETGKDALIFEGEAVTTDEGTALTLSEANPYISLPYRLSPNGLNFDFFVLEEKMNFNAVTLKLTDKNGTAVTVTIKDLTSVSPELLICGKDTSVKVIKNRQTFSSGASEKYAGKNYYTFSIVYENFYKALLSGTAIQAYVEKDVRGVKFSGFDGGVYADISVEEIAGAAAEIVITRIGNQLFYSSGFAYGDVTGPAVYSPSFRLGNANVRKGYALDVSGLKAYDVLKGNSSVNVTLTKPDGTKVYENVSPEKAQKHTLSSLGVYLLKITAKDGGGAVMNLTYRFAVDDDTPPVLSVSGEIVKTAKAGDTIALAAASATDESGVTLKVCVFRPDGKIDFIAENGASFVGGEYRLSRSGVQRIVYSAEDEYGNVTTATYYVNAEDK